MRLISLEIENFLKFERLSLEFPDGLTGILGPNGAGKSSLVEAVAWALYGSPASRTKNEGIPFHRTLPCRVALTLELDGDEYRVTRELRGSGFTAYAEVAVNGVPVEVGTERVNRLLTARLRMDHRAFLVSFFARQKEVDALISWEPRERKKYILRLLGLERVEQALADLRRDVTDRERELRARENALPDKEQVLAACRAARDKAKALNERVNEARASLEASERSLQDARERMEILEAQQRQYLALEHDRDSARHALETIRQREAIFADRVRDLHAKAEELRRLEPELAPLAELRARLQAMEVALRLERQRVALQRTLAGHERTARELAAQASTLQRQLGARDRVAQALAQAEEKLTHAREEMAEVQGKVAASETRLTQIQKEGQQLYKDLKLLMELGPKGKCPTCQRVLEGSYTAVVGHLKSQMDALKAEREDYTSFLTEDRTRLQALQQELKEGEARQGEIRRELQHLTSADARLEEIQRSLERAVAEAEKTKTALADLGAEEYDQGQHKELAKQVRALEQTERRVIGLRQEVEHLPAEEEAVAQARQALPEREEALRRAEEALSALRFDPVAFEACRGRCRELDTQREERTRAYHAVDRELERALAEQQQADARREEYDRQVEDISILRAEKENQDELLALLQAFRVNLIGRIRPALAGRVSGLVRDLTDGKYDRVELDEDYNLWMYEEGERRELRSFSGGENDLVHLCLRLAISEMIGQAAGGVERGFLVLDEVLGSQDSERRSLILQALARLSSRFRQILMITHVEEIKEMVEHVVQLEETANGSSTISVS